MSRLPAGGLTTVEVHAEGEPGRVVVDARSLVLGDTMAERLAYCREHLQELRTLLLHEPRWVLLEDATGALEEEHRRLVMSIFEHELAGAAVISISRSTDKSFYTRVLEFSRWPDGVVPVRLHPRPRLARPADPAAPEPLRALA